MRAPRKLYLVISRKAQDDLLVDDGVWAVFEKRQLADLDVELANSTAACCVTDWRVETYVKGD